MGILLYVFLGKTNDLVLSYSISILKDIEILLTYNTKKRNTFYLYFKSIFKIYFIPVVFKSSIN